MIKALVRDTQTVLHIDLDQEMARASFYRPLLFYYGVHVGIRPQFDRAKYSVAESWVRCYDGAIALATKHDLIYMEGLAILDCTGAGRLPLAHGWCVDRSGALVDPTMSKVQHEPAILYYGIPIKKDFAHAWNAKHGYYGCLDGTPDSSDMGVHSLPPELWLDTDYPYNPNGSLKA